VSGPPQEPEATVVVSTRDRRDDLLRLLPSLLAQTARCEILVVDDGSTDGTGEMVRSRFPEVRVERSDRSLGLIAQRNRGARLARGPIIVSVDDDAELPAPDTVARTLADFDHPRIGAVAIPCVDVTHGPEVVQRAPDREHRWVVPSYWGTAHAVRRDVFLSLGGYREEFERQCEELDYCLRQLGAGYVTRLGTSEPMLHFESPRRNRAQIAFYDRRNNVLHGWRNVPMPYLPVRVAKVAAATPGLARRHGDGGSMARGLAAGAGRALRHPRPRRPISRAAYRLDHLLRKTGPRRLDELEPLLDAVPLRPA
jgi:glycosyltransferase involved in cell wall biosynthesis